MVEKSRDLTCLGRLSSWSRMDGPRGGSPAGGPYNPTIGPSCRPADAGSDDHNSTPAPVAPAGSGGPRIAVLIPCYNEELTIADVVREFRAELPRAAIYVFDNNSTDRTAAHALAAGARVHRERRQGKGYVIQSMFRDVDADVYVLVDGDGTYAAGSVHRVMAPILAGETDMVIGSRLHRESHSAFRFLNRLGNRSFLWLINSIFRVNLTDVLSGFRAFSRQFVKGIPLFGGGFEIETELTIKALYRGYRLLEVPVDLATRPEGSYSKIRHFRDGIIITKTIFALFRDYKPLTFFGSLGLLLVGVGAVMGLRTWNNGAYLSGRTDFVPVVLVAVMVLGGILSGFTGVVLHTVLRRFQEFEHQLRVLMHENYRSQSPGGTNKAGRTEPSGTERGGSPLDQGPTKTSP
jgi:glycosyltransferase involved in cell wall biosynthesis